MVFIELILFSLGVISVIYSILWNDPQGQIYTLVIMTIAVAESALGLGLLIVFYRNYQKTDLDSISSIRT